MIYPGVNLLNKPHVTVYRTIENRFLQKIKQHCHVYYYPDNALEHWEKFIEDLRKSDALFGAGMKIDESIINNAPKLKVISNFSAGFDNLDLHMLTEKGIMATNVPGVLNDTVADLFFGLILSTARRIPEFDRYIREEMWEGPLSYDDFGVDVYGQTIGLVGLGGIGKAIAKRAQGFNMDIHYYKRNRDQWAEEQLDVQYHNHLHSLLEISDFVCLALPLTEETYHLIGKEELSIMKPTAILINGSRGAIVDEEALIHALKTKEILGAGLDVFEKEPLNKNNELLKLSNVVLTPHIGSSTLKTRHALIEHGIDNLLTALQGKKPKNLLNKVTL